jgi:hypothetical protein
VRLKVFTTACVIFSLSLMVAYPWILGHKPHTRPEAHAFFIRYLLYLCAIVIALVAAGVGSVLILRQAREEYRKEKEELMRELLEATLRDHSKVRPEDQE